MVAPQSTDSELNCSYSKSENSKCSAKHAVGFQLLANSCETSSEVSVKREIHFSLIS